MSAEAVKPKGGGSFVWKITLRQTLHILVLFVWVNVVITLLLWGGIWLAVERSASSIAGGEAQPAVLGERFIQVATQEGQAANRFIPTALLERLNLIPGGRGVRFDEHRQWQYVIFAQTPQDNVMAITFTPGILWEWYLHGMRILLIVQGIMLLAGLFEISGMVRRTLRPISELTMVTQQSMSARSELHLGSTIDVLNAINEQRLDTRIDVENEREELRGLAIALNSMLDRVDSAYHSQLRFVSDASHELRTPISVIQGYANLLSRWGKEDPKALEESIAAIKSEAESMKELVEQLLFLARSDNNSISLRVDSVDISEIVREVARESEMICGAGHSIECPTFPPLLVSGDAGLLKQALRILVDNAFKYTPENGKITLDAKELDGMVAFSVTDSGMGIAPDELAKLFDRFYRADASRTRQTGGAGLGLSIAKWIVDSHGGSIEILSREGLGTRVSVKLKAASVQAQNQTASA